MEDTIIVGEIFKLFFLDGSIVPSISSFMRLKVNTPEWKSVKL